MAGEVAQALTVIVIMVLAGVARSYRSGYLYKVLQERDQPDRTLAEIDRNVKNVQETVDDIDTHVEDVSESILILHKDDDGVDVGALQEKLEVESLPSDITTND